jgi:hypothetical protein
MPRSHMHRSQIRGAEWQTMARRIGVPAIVWLAWLMTAPV